MASPLFARLAVVATTGLGLLAGCGGATAPQKPPSPPIPPSDLTGAKTVVSLTFDDGIASQLEALPLLRSGQMRATFYVNSGRVGDPGRMTWGQIGELKSSGHEVGGHTLYHSDVAALPPAQAREEICADRAALIAHGFAVTDFAYPLGSSSPRAQAIVRGCGYRSARTVGGIRAAAKCRRLTGVSGRCPFAERLPPPRRYDIRTPGSVRAQDTLAMVQANVSQAERHGGGWVVLVFHGVCDGCGRYGISPAVLRPFLHWLGERRARGTVVATVAQALSAGPVRP